MEVLVALNPELLAILACPKCKGELRVLGDCEGLLCPACALVYPVREEIPIMLIDEAISLERWEAGERGGPK
jgi:uncharacterized protein YbaR (Trm112 family)